MISGLAGVIGTPLFCLVKRPRRLRHTLPGLEVRPQRAIASSSKSREPCLDLGSEIYNISYICQHLRCTLDKKPLLFILRLATRASRTTRRADSALIVGKRTICMHSGEHKFGPVGGDAVMPVANKAPPLQIQPVVHRQNQTQCHHFHLDEALAN